MDEQSITVLGAGSYGTALAFCLSRKQLPVWFWGRNPDHMMEMAQSRRNLNYLPEFEFPESLHVEPDLQQAIARSQDILLVVPSHAFGKMLSDMKPFLTSNHRIVWATKGLEPDTGRLLQDVAKEIIGIQIPIGVLSGPTFAKEMAKGLPTAITLASDNQELISAFAQKLHCDKTFRVYKSDDFIGVQLGGAVKNVIAIGAGLSDGMGFGANARTALITRGLAELTRLGIKMGANPQTFMGMAGLGDLVLTCTDNQSRNRRFGLALGAGKAVEEAIAEIGQVVEGYRNTKEVFVLAERLGVEVPITQQIHEVLYNGKSVKKAASALLGREIKYE